MRADGEGGWCLAVVEMKWVPEGEGTWEVRVMMVLEWWAREYSPRSVGVLAQ